MATGPLALKRADEADARVGDEAGDQRRPPGLDLLQQQPLRGRDVDHAEVAAGEHDQLGVRRVRALRLEHLVDALGLPPAGRRCVPVPARSSSTESTLPQPSMLPSIPVVSESVSDRHRSLSSMP